MTDHDYLKALFSDLKYKYDLSPKKKLDSIFIGGGTPSLFDTKCLEQLLESIRDLFNITQMPECTIEINPESFNMNKMMAYKKMGINRISIGGQSFNSDYLKILGRVHNDRQLRDTLSAVSTHFNNFNIDIMYALPGQNPVEAHTDIEEALKFNPPHLSWYQLTIEPGTAFYKHNPNHLPSEEDIIVQENLCRETLQLNGFHRYEISAFSKTNFECDHNNNYWHFGDYIGIGAGASSKLTTEDQKIIRCENQRKPENYLIGHPNTWVTVNHKDQVFEYMLNRLRLFKPIPFTDCLNKTNISMSALTKQLNSFKQKNLISINNDSFELTEFGYQFYNDVVSSFLEG